MGMLLLAVAFCFPAGSVGAEQPKEPDPEKVLLRYRFRKDEVLRWNVLQSLKIATTVRGKREDVESTSRSTKIWKVVKLDPDGTATFEYTVQDVDMHHFQTGRDTAKYNSRIDRTIPPNFSNLEGRIGVPLAHLAIDTLGETKYKSSLREYSSKDLESRIVIPLPKDPIAVGQRWSVPDPTEVKQPDGNYVKINVRQEFTLESLNNGIAKIKFRSDVLTPSLSPSVQARILDKYNEGHVLLDLDAGHIISQELRVDKRVTGFQGTSSNIHHRLRLLECCCGLKSCELCSE